MGGVTIKSSVYIKRKSSKNKQRNRLDRREDSNQVRVKKIKKIKRTKQSKATTSANSLSALQTSEFPRLNGDHCTHRGAAEEALNIDSSGVTQHSVFSKEKRVISLEKVHAAKLHKQTRNKRPHYIYCDMVKEKHGNLLESVRSML